MPTPVALTNYTLKSNQGFNGSSWDNCSKWWPGDGGASSMPEQAAWICNQFDDCDGFSSATDPNNKSWVNFYFKSGNSGRSITTSGFHNDNNRNTYVKNGAWSRKAYNPDYNDPSILQNPASKILFNNGTTFGTNKVGVSGAQGSNNIYTANWGSGNTQNPDYGCCNNIHDVNVPLGWRFFVGDNGTMAGCNGTAAVYFNQGDGQWHHIADGAWDDGILVENTGFDVYARFDDMTNLGVDPADAKQIKLRWCSASNANLDSQKCKNFFADTTPSGAGLSWYATKLALCDGQGGHASPNDSSCVNAINNVQKSTAVVDGVSQGTATALVQTYCDANPNDALCGCYNVTKYSSYCISDASKRTLPGCDNLNTDFGQLPSYASVIGSDKFCASSDCITSALSSSTEFMPVARSPQQTCPTIQACIQNFAGANFSGASLTAECKQTLNITTAPPGTPPSPGAVGAGSPPTGTPPSGTPVTRGSDGSTLPITNPTVANVLNTKTKQYGAIGGLIFIILCCCCLLVLLMGGDD